MPLEIAGEVDLRHGATLTQHASRREHRIALAGVSSVRLMARGDMARTVISGWVRNTAKRSWSSISRC
jgi:hypothetical protein